MSNNPKTNFESIPLEEPREPKFSEYVNMIAGIEQLKKENSQLIRMIDVLKHSRDPNTVERTGSELSNEKLEALNARIAELENENQSLRKNIELSDAKSEKEPELCREIQGLRYVIKQVRTEENSIIQSSNRKTEEFEDPNANSEELLSWFSALRRDYASLSNQLSNTLTELDSVKKENIELHYKVFQLEQELNKRRSTKDEREFLQIQLEKSIKELGELKPKMKELEYKSNQLREARENIQILVEELESIHCLVKDKDNEIQNLNISVKQIERKKSTEYKDNEELNKRLNEIEPNIRELMNVKKKVALLAIAFESLVAIVKAKDKEIDSYNQIVEQSIVEKEKIEQELMILNRSVQEKQKQGDESNETILFLEQSLKNLRSENQRIEADLSAMEDLNKQMRKTSDIISQDLEGMNAQIRLRDQRISDLEKDKKELMIENDRITHELVEIKTSEDTIVADLKQLIIKLSEELNKLSDTLKIRDTQLKELQIQLKEQSVMRAELIEMNEKANASESKNEKVDALMQQKDKELELLRKKASNVMDLKGELEEMLNERVILYQERDRLTDLVYQRDVELEHLKLKVSKIEELLKENEMLQQSKSKRDKEIEELTSNLKAMEDKVNKQEDSIGDAALEKAHLLQEIEQLIQKNEAIKHDLDQLIPERDLLVKVVESKDADIAVLSSNFSILDREYGSLKKDRLIEAQELAEFRKVLEHVNREKDDFVRTLEESDGRIAAMGLDLNKLEDALQDKANEIDSIRNQIESLKVENSNLIVSFSTEKNDLIAQIENLNKDRTDFTTERESLLKTIHDREAQISLMAESLNKFQDQINLVSLELDQTRARSLLREKEIQNIESQFAAKQQENKNLQDQFEYLKTEQRELKGLFDKVTIQRDEILISLNERDSIIASLRKELDQLRNDLQAKNIEFDNLVSQNNAQAANIDTIQKEVNERDKMIESFTHELNELKATHSNLYNLLEALTSERDTLITQTYTLKQENDHLILERDNLMQLVTERDFQIADMGKTLKSMHDEIQRLDSELDQSRTQCTTFENKIQKLRKKRQDLKAKESDLVNSEEMLAREKESLVTQVKVLTQNLADMMIKQDNLNGIILSRDNQILAMGQTLKNLEVALEAKNNENENLSNQAYRLTNDLTETRQFLDNSNEAIYMLAQRIEEQKKAAEINLLSFKQDMTFQRDNLITQNETLKQDLVNMTLERNNLVQIINQKDLQSSVMALDITKMQEDINRLIQELNNYSQQTALLGEKTKSLESQLLKKDQENKEIRTHTNSEIKTLREERDRLLQKQSDRENKLITLQAQVSLLSNAIQAKNSENEYLNRNVDRLEAEIENLKQELDNHNKIIADFDKRHYEQRAKESNLVESNDNMTREREDLLAQNEYFRVQIRQMEDNIANLSFEKESLVKTLDEKDTKIASLESEIRSLGHDNNRLLEFIGQLEQDRDEIIETLHKRDSESRRQKKFIDEGYSELKARRNELSAYESENQKLSLANQEQEKEINDLTAKLNALTQLEYKVQELYLENDKLRLQLESFNNLKLEYILLQKNLQRVAGERDKSLRSLSESMNGIAKLELGVLEYESLKNCFQVSKEDILSQCTTFSQKEAYINDLEDAIKKYENICQSYRQLVSKYEAICQENENLKQRSQDFELKIEDVERKNELLEQIYVQNEYSTDDINERLAQTPYRTEEIEPNLRKSITKDKADEAKESGFEYQTELLKYKDRGYHDFNKTTQQQMSAHRFNYYQPTQRY